MLPDGPLLEQSLKACAGALIRPPRGKPYRPDRDRLAARFEQFKRAAELGGRSGAKPSTGVSEVATQLSDLQLIATEFPRAARHHVDDMRAPLEVPMHCTDVRQVRASAAGTAAGGRRASAAPGAHDGANEVDRNQHHVPGPVTSRSSKSRRRASASSPARARCASGSRRARIPLELHPVVRASRADRRVRQAADGSF
jgi:hypothetical protein